MTVSIVVPWRDMGCIHRRASRNWTEAYWRTNFPDWEIVHADAEPFTRAAALNEGARIAEGDVLVQADPDSIVAAIAVREAVRLASLADGVVIPFSRYVYLNQRQTAELLAGSGMTDQPDIAKADDTGTTGLGNVTVYSRSTWQAVGGYDERFGMWGGDDACFVYASETLVASTRKLEGLMLHLWHPRLPESQPGHPEYVRQFALIREYQDACREGADAVAALLRNRAEGSKL